MTDPLDVLPADLRDEIRRIWHERVAGGAERFRQDGDRGGVAGQRAISQLLKRAGIGEDDERWLAVVEHGRGLYYGREDRAASAPAPASSSVPAASEGPGYTTGEGFRARAEARQRRFRAEVLRVGWKRYGHLLEDEAAAAGANFLHPVARERAEARAAAGKGVHAPRTFGNMLASQAMCFNLFGPLVSEPSLAAELLAPFVPGLVAVDAIELEYTPSYDVFRDQRGKAGVDADVLIELSGADGSKSILVVETKFVEPSFSTCGHRKDGAADPCPADVILGDDFQGCRYASRNGFLYWHRSAETGSLRLPVVREVGCPFGGELWQPWANHTLAHVEGRRRGARRAIFAVCAPRANGTLAAEARLDELRRYVTDPSTVLFLPLEDVISRLEGLVLGRDDALREWARRMRERYVVQAEPADLPGSSSEAGRSSVLSAGHRRALEWMSTPAFPALVAIHRAACRGRAAIYFRPTDQGLVRIALHPSASGYVGFRRDAGDEGHTLRPGAPLPTPSDVEERLRAFEAWLPSVRRGSDEEKGVIPWLACALESGLALPELGEGWAFLHQEWRFVGDAGKPRKSDILAVHVPTGRLGIVELKARASQLAAARTQVDEYARYWMRDADELAPFFTSLLRAIGTAYGNEAAAKATVLPRPAELFVGVASPLGGVRIEKR